ncbi:hypothetical protein LXA43DRAFT_352830 [Ganoderma leucocontextum]|nr:hypothetical protein LXA43DRAFT_352830 [Ganoderma leucocontextum]
MFSKPFPSLDAMDYALEPSSLLSGRAGPQDLNASVAFWTDMVIVCTAGLLFFLTLPRAVARLGPGGGWSNGHFFRAFFRSSLHWPET